MIILVTHIRGHNLLSFVRRMTSFTNSLVGLIKEVKVVKNTMMIHGVLIDFFINLASR